MIGIKFPTKHTLGAYVCVSHPGMELRAPKIAMFEILQCTETGKWIYFRVQRCQKYGLHQFLFKAFLVIVEHSALNWINFLVLVHNNISNMANLKAPSSIPGGDRHMCPVSFLREIYLLVISIFCSVQLLSESTLPLPYVILFPAWQYWNPSLHFRGQ